MRSFAPVAAGVYPRNDFADYRSSTRRAPRAAPIVIPETPSELSGPYFSHAQLRAGAGDLTRQVAGGEAQGQRIIVCGRVTDEYGRPEREALVEVWQANAAGRYRHDGDQHDAPLDPHFTGAGAVVTDKDGMYSFVTVEPGIYPWPNHFNAWRPKHIHFSLFGPAWAARLVTQMYFPGDPTLTLDPIFRATADERARARLVASFDLAHTVPDYALAYRFDIVLRGPAETPLERAP